MNLKMHALRVGQIEVKQRYVNAGEVNRLLRLTGVLLDNEFVRIPVYVGVIEHPEGVIVIDTGLTAAMTDPEYFPAVQRIYWQTQYRFHITRDEEIDVQLRALGISTEAVRWVVLTHTHFDHSAAVHHFPKSEFLISRREYNDLMRFRSAHFGFPAKMPDWFDPTLIDFLPERMGPFQRRHDLTVAGDVILVPTPGHTPGHLSVIVDQGEKLFFFGGDTSFDQDSLLSGDIDAPSFNTHEVHETRQRILSFARAVPLVYLVTHDKETPERLANQTQVFSHNQRMLYDELKALSSASPTRSR